MRTKAPQRFLLICWILPATVLACALSPGRAVAQPPAPQVVVFGDSLSDSGNAFTLLKESATPPDYTLGSQLLPDAPYARGGHHLSNGATWIEQLLRPLGLASGSLPAFRGSNPRAANYSVPIARAYGGGNTVTLTLLVDTFLLDVGGIAPSDALYVIEIGGNDVRDALNAYASGQNGGAIIQGALLAIATNISRLYAAGARHFLVWNVPNVAHTPAVRSLGPTAVLLAAQLTQVFNAGLAALLTQASAAPGIDIVRFDAYALINAIVANPQAYGLSNVTDACVTPNDPPFFCQNAEEYLFWDGVHPTKAVHAIIANEIATLLGF